MYSSQQKLWSNQRAAVKDAGGMKGTFEQAAKSLFAHQIAVIIFIIIVIAIIVINAIIIIIILIINITVRLEGWIADEGQQAECLD